MVLLFHNTKDPDKGRLSVYNPKTKKITVLFDGEDHPNLANPNGIALLPMNVFYMSVSRITKTGALELCIST